MRERAPILGALRLPPNERRVAAEAAFELIRASLALKLAPRGRAVGMLGRVPGSDGDKPVDAASAAAAERLGAMVARVASRLPWKPNCLRQAIAAQRMLRRREIPGVLHLGITQPRERAAHAWVTVGGDPIVGADGLTDYAPIAAFELGRRS
jgi:hypothetical protein